MPPSYYPGASQSPFASAVGEALGGFQQGRQMQRDSRMDLEAQEERRIRLQILMDQMNIWKERLGYGAPQPAGGAPGAPAAETGAGGPPVPEDPEVAPDAMQGALGSQSAGPAAPVSPSAQPQGQPQLAERGVLGRVREMGGRVGRGLKERLSTFSSGGFQPFEPGPMPVKTGPSIEERGWDAQAREGQATRASAEGMNTQDNETALEVARLNQAAEFARINAMIDQRKFDEVQRAIQQYAAMTDAARLQYELGDEAEAQTLSAQAQSIQAWVSQQLRIQPGAAELNNTFDRFGTDDTVRNEPPPAAPISPAARPDTARRVGQVLRGRGGGSTW